MDLSILTNAELKSSLENLTGKERAVTIKILFHLIEIERRGIFRDEGYSCLFDYCTRQLKYSKNSAYRRIAAARCLKDNPELEGMLLNGSVTLCSVTTAAKCIEKKVTKLEEIVGCSKREVENLIAKAEPVAKKPAERIRPLAVSTSMPLFNNVQVEERYSVSLSFSKEEYELFEQARARLSNTLKRDISVAGAVSKLSQIFLKPKTRKVKQHRPESRYVPLWLKRAIYNRDNSQCCFVSTDGTRCCEKRYLQVDHILPFALGGKTELNNLRLLCPAHNKLMAERHFGKDFISACVDHIQR